MNSNTDELITRFLLDELSPEERTKIEERFLTDNEFFEQLLSAEESLIDRYIGGRLDTDQQERARKLFQSSPARRDDMEFTKELVSSLRQARAGTSHIAKYGPPLTSPGWTNVSRFGLVILLVVGFAAVAGAIYLYSQKRKLESELLALERTNQESRDRLAEEARSRAESERQLAIERENRLKAEELLAQSQPYRAESFSVLLAPTSLERGGNGRLVTLKPQTQRVQFQLELDKSWHYSQYQLVITTFDGHVVRSENAIDARQIKQGRVVVTLSSSLLKYNDYRIELKGRLDNGTFVHVADYVFKVRK
jgi:hypothetical protein